ncbi:50S ribosomal protein L4 [Ureaplasma canigenitalium]|uniref:50S ribosomal protein L4 n=1 Tax=Ureaplasma canigenitalium TaxID=42092 RepID=UPI0004E2527A|nr:50S ribosomal protein L4 [Ureaplasma canigenitalium]
MTSIKVFDINGAVKSNLTLNSVLFTEEPHRQAMFDAVIAENAAERQGTHSTLTKGEVRGGGKKPWRQKHTGRARTGSTRNPQWTGGGVVFGPKPNRNYTKKVNTKVYQLALRSALTLKLNDQNIYGLEKNASLSKPNTKTIVEFLNNTNLTDKKILLVLDENTNTVNIMKSANNLEKVYVKLWNQVSVRDIMHANVLILAEETIEHLQRKVGY